MGYLQRGSILTKDYHDLTVITRAKDLARYVVIITERSPKQFRFTYISRMQNISLDVLESLYMANETYAKGSDAKEKYQKRLDFQHRALTQIKLLAYFAQLALESKAILSRQYEHMAKLCTDTQFLTAAWIKSDKERFKL
jgi:hypothetical protein